MNRNALKSRLGRGEPAFGVSIMFPAPQVVEILGRVGFHWVLLDCEHGTIGPEALESMVRAAEACGLTAIARPRTARPEDILDVLEKGPAGVQVPHVNTAAQAADVVAAVKYHPLGRRGLAARTRPAGYGVGLDLDDYVARSNEETLVCVQIEEREGLDQLDAMLEVPGVDVYFLGPSDLSQSLGHPGDPDHPDVHGAMREAFRRISARGRTAGSAGSSERCHRYRAEGALYLYTHLPTLLADSGGDFLERVREVSAHPVAHSRTS